jgi:hypothetical protein
MLEVYELLDRLELLYSDNRPLSDLRRAYIDQDLSSIFRIVNDNNKDDLRKLILENNTWKLWPLLDRLVDTQFSAAFKSFFVNNVVYDKDCFSRGQLQSKLWLVEELKKLNVDLGTVFLCAGWYGILATMIFESTKLQVKSIRSFDIDETTVDIAETFNKLWFVNDWRFKALTMTILDINYEVLPWQYWSNKNNRLSYPITDTPDTIINTSCEHITEFDSWYNMLPKGKLLVLQANDFVDLDMHTNCYNDLEDFELHTPMNTVLYSGMLQLEKYNRFMRIGFK